MNKCQRCPKQATLHITEVLGEDRFEEVHLCEECAKKYLYEPQQQKQAAKSDPSEEAESAKKSQGLPENYDSDVLQPFMETLALEITRALQFFFTSTSYNQVDQIVLAGGCSLLPGLDELVSKRAGVGTMVANPFANMQASERIRPRQLALDAPMLMIATGLAMRSFE